MKTIFTKSDIESLIIREYDRDIFEKNVEDLINIDELPTRYEMNRCEMLNKSMRDLAMKIKDDIERAVKEDSFDMHHNIQYRLPKKDGEAICRGLRLYFPGLHVVQCCGNSSLVQISAPWFYD